MTTTTANTEDRVTGVALDLFGSQGYAVTSMEQVRRHAGVSNGSLYHLFPNKAALAARLHSNGMIQCQDGIIRAIEAASSAEKGVRAAIAFQTTWVDQHTQLARLVYADMPDDVLVAAAPTLDGPSRKYVRVVDNWLGSHVDSGAIADRPFVVLHALWLGPTQEFCRHWLRGRGRLRPRHVADQLAEGAWHALVAR
ncbi:MAG: TetR/AcrR family transcriptional regulator [Acidimicrobiales bacterium]